MTIRGDKTIDEADRLVSDIGDKRHFSQVI